MDRPIYSLNGCATRYTGLARSKATFRCKRYLATLFFEQEESFMLNGKRFKLKERTLAIEILDGERKAVSIPIGTILKVIPGATDAGQTVDVLWGNRTLEMFSCDVTMRGTEIIGPQSQGLDDRAAVKRGSV
jgi:hypothetical protein